MKKSVSISALQSESVGTKPMVSLLAPVYNEEALLRESVAKLYQYMEGLESQYDWELVLINDGSKDQTKVIADELANQHSNLRVFHHQTNRNLGGALQTGFSQVNGDFVIVLDIDLSYGPKHIERLLESIQTLGADVVCASPYMKGGTSKGVPFFRLLLSKSVNRFMRMSAGTDIHTFTGMVRVYRKDFLQILNLKSSTYAINPEIIYKAVLLRAKIREIPGHLDWTFQNDVGVGRTSSIRIIKGILSGLMTGFIFRPYAFFMMTGIFLLVIAMYVIGWIFVNTFQVYPEMAQAAITFEEAFTNAVSLVFKERPYSFLVGGITLIISLLFLGIGFLSLQSKRYFDELFHLGTTIYKTHMKKPSKTD